MEQSQSKIEELNKSSDPFAISLYIDPPPEQILSKQDISKQDISHDLDNQSLPDINTDDPNALHKRIKELFDTDLDEVY